MSELAARFQIFKPHGSGRRRSRFSAGRDFLLFLAFGGTAAATSLLAGWLMYGSGLFPGVPYWCAITAASGCGMIVNFGLNYSQNFRFRGRSAMQQFWTFSIVSGGGIVLTSLVSSGLLSLLEHYRGPEFHLLGFDVHSNFAAHFAAVGLVTFYSFPAHKFISFNVGIRARLQHLLPLVAWVR